MKAVIALLFLVSQLHTCYSTTCRSDYDCIGGWKCNVSKSECVPDTFNPVIFVVSFLGGFFGIIGCCCVIRCCVTRRAVQRMELTVQNNQQTTYVTPAINTVSQFSLPLYQTPNPPSASALEKIDEPPAYGTLF